MDSLAPPEEGAVIEINEKSAAVGCWLDAMYGSLELLQDTDCENVADAFRRLCDKYDCPSLLYARMASMVYRSTHHSEIIQTLFVEACHHRNLKMARCLLVRAAYSGESMLNPTKIQPIILDRLDGESVKALLRIMNPDHLHKYTVHRSHRPYNRGIRWDEVAETFHW